MPTRAWAWRPAIAHASPAFGNRDQWGLSHRDCIQRRRRLSRNAQRRPLLLRSGSGHHAGHCRARVGVRRRRPRPRPGRRSADRLGLRDGQSGRGPDVAAGLARRAIGRPRRAARLAPDLQRRQPQRPGKRRLALRLRGLPQHPRDHRRLSHRRVRRPRRPGLRPRFRGPDRHAPGDERRPEDPRPPRKRRDPAEDRLLHRLRRFAVQALRAGVDAAILQARAEARRRGPMGDSATRLRHAEIPRGQADARIPRHPRADRRQRLPA